MKLAGLVIILLGLDLLDECGDKVLRCLNGRICVGSDGMLKLGG
jgi:hypothetical protein